MMNKCEHYTQYTQYPVEMLFLFFETTPKFGPLKKAQNLHFFYKTINLKIIVNSGQKRIGRNVLLKGLRPDGRFSPIMRAGFWRWYLKLLFQRQSSGFYQNRLESNPIPYIPCMPKHAFDPESKMKTFPAINA